MYAQFSFPKLSLANKIIIILTAGVSVAALLLQAIARELSYYIYFLSVTPVYFMPWQPVTLFLINLNLFGLLFDLFALWMFGSVLESREGTKHYLTSFFISIIISGVSYFLLAKAFNVRAPFYGITPGVLSLLCGFTYFWPNSQIYVFGIFPVKSKWLMLFYGIILFLSMIMGLNAQGIHIGIMFLSIIIGVVVSILYIHFIFLEYSFLRSFIGRFNNTYKPFKEEKKIKLKREEQKEPAKEKVVSVRDWERRQVDLLLEKVSKYGINSLNKKEKEFLDRISPYYSSKEDET